MIFKYLDRSKDLIIAACWDSGYIPHKTCIVWIIQTFGYDHMRQAEVSH